MCFGAGDPLGKAQLQLMPSREEFCTLLNLALGTTGTGTASTSTTTSGTTTGSSTASTEYWYSTGTGPVLLVLVLDRLPVTGTVGGLLREEARGLPLARGSGREGNPRLPASGPELSGPDGRGGSGEGIHGCRALGARLKVSFFREPLCVCVTQERAALHNLELNKILLMLRAPPVRSPELA